MAWNDDDNKKNGWDKKDSPPDLDEALRKLQKRLSRLLGGVSRGNNNGSSGAGAKYTSWFSLFILLLIGGLWFVSGIFILGPAEEAAVLRFGKYIGTYGPGGLHWVPRLIETPYIVDVQRVENYSYTSEMLNKDENIVSVEIAVQYRVDNVRDYLFNVVSPRLSLEQATASALRQVIGQSTLDEVLTFGRAKVRDEISKQLKLTLDLYHTGIKVMDVVMQPAKAPDQVKHAFDDAIKAQEDEQKYINQAQAYQANVIPQAQGQAKKLIQEAEAYQKQITLKAIGDIAKYTAILVPYKKAPQVTRERMYLTTIEEVLINTTKVFMDSSNGNNSLMYLPIQEMLKRSNNLVARSNIENANSDDEPSVDDPISVNNSRSESQRLSRDSYQGRRGRM